MPVITSSTDDVTVNEAASQFLLQCNYTGVPSPAVSWYKNNVQLTSSDPDKISIVTNQITVYSVVETDEGVYQCIINNEAGSVDVNITVDVIRKIIQLVNTLVNNTAS